MYKTLFVKPISGPSSSSFPVHRSFIEILSDEPQLWDRYNARGKNVMLPEVPFDRFRIGSQFFVLTRQHALVVIRDRRLWRKFKLPCFNNVFLLSGGALFSDASVNGGSGWMYSFTRPLTGQSV
ncbi:UNVERIFIED_CONTAM: hypothetical protein Sradi_6570100 [Sesamum radiatum]|uniref:Uncharacterized protein n=1 Tax=Sesamum radiatum TaxID=300843 RepID=A0AAW2JY35_SESRA